MALRNATCSWLAALSLAAWVSTSSAQTRARSSLTAVLDRRVAELRNSPPELYAFLLRMPKGADLHNHLSGAVYAERFIEEAANNSLCIDPRTSSIAGAVGQNCPEGDLPAGRALSDTHLFASLVDSLSMRDFVPGHESGHDHFFDTFDKFSAASSEESGKFAADVTRRAAEQNESYLELMATSGGGAVSRLGAQVGLEGGFDAAAARLRSSGLASLVDALKKRVDQMEAQRRDALDCDTQDSPACHVTVRYIYQVLRASPKEQVFAQVFAGFMLAASDPLVIAINLVQPEDWFVPMRDYHLHMQMVDYAKRLYPNVHITLHAGELASGVVPPEGLRFHIHEAVAIGHAERIGHGVDIMYENNAVDLLKTMAQRHIAVEINLTSNDLILGVKGKDHPFPVYRRYGVPVVLSTDDEGVSRTHLTQEYLRATLTYNLTYSDLKQIARNSIEYSFLPGSTSDKTSEKGRLAADLEGRFQRFEQSVLHDNSPANHRDTP